MLLGRHDQINDTVGDEIKPRVTRTLARGDLVWLSRGVSITITHAAPCETAADSGCFGSLGSQVNWWQTGFNAGR